MNHPPVNRTQYAVLPLRQLLFLGAALLITLAAGQFYYSWQTARLADQVAAQTLVLTQLKASRVSTQVTALEPLPVGDTTPARVENVQPEQRWVF
ncbi:hypothetical protein N5F23_22925 [Pseudomonas sichuanensis]|uniref:hypothetical protein n=1 Tax=Pseudomonas TaxID=286 RepID=UPI00129B552C|nr:MULTISPECIES: hypothetical protein [Pseudomonas]MDH0733730.1 hypothetical protein [Pseudomonas sichuanensis]MDH1585446.1 hypothetical protein [Pseudomonas sichuanensis]MDH1595415.1 hypothetical protein [Pseudomonas sichuanensis]MDH1600422.1 hypothetical protein [Pseudomonas sichuanensis]